MDDKSWLYFVVPTFIIVKECGGNVYVSDVSANELINLTRLKRAAELLAEGDYKIYEVAGIVGYRSQTNFGRNLLKQFGMTPSAYQLTKHNEPNTQ